MKKTFLVMSLSILLFLTACGGSSSKEAKELLQRILQLVGIPQSIVVNICQDGNANGFCDVGEVKGKLTINKSDSVQDLLQKIQFEADGSYILKDFDPTKKILLELVDNNTFNNSGQEVVLSFNPKEDVQRQELSIFQSLIDNGLLREEELVKIRESDKRALLDQVLLENLFQNQTLLIENNLTQQEATLLNLGYIAEGLRDINISGDFVDRLEACDTNTTCQERIILDANQQTEINEEEAQRIAENKNLEGTGDRNTLITQEETNSSEESTSTPNSVEPEQEFVPVSKTEKSVADGYLIKLPSPAVAYCNDTEYSSSLVIGAKGKILFQNITLPNNCHIYIPSGATIDSNNNGVLDASDKILNFSMKGSSEGTFISPLTTMLIEKESNGEDVTQLKTMVQNFDPVACASTIATANGTEKVKNQKLMLLMEVLKTALAQSPNANIADINISAVLKTDVNDSIDDFDKDALSSAFSSDIQSVTYIKSNQIRRFMNTFSSLDASKIDINSFYISISDDGQNIEDAVRASLKNTLDPNENLLVAIAKSDANLTFLYQEFLAMDLGSLDSMGKPIAKAGTDVTEKQGVELTLSALGSFDINGYIATYEWKEDNLTVATTETFSKNNFSLGEHNLTLTITDNDGLKASDSVRVNITENPNFNNNSPILIDDLIAGQVTFKNTNNTVIAVPSDAQIRIVPSRFQNDNSGWNGLACTIATDGTFGTDCYTDENESGVREAFNDPSETYQIVVYKNHIEPDFISWNCGEDVYMYVGDSEVSSRWEDIVVTPEDYQDRSADTCGDTLPIKKTGQTKSYAEGGTEVFDGSLKDDGFYQKGLDHNYSRNNDREVVTDHVTKLMWQDDSVVSSVQKPWITQANYDAQDYNNTTGDTATTYCIDLIMGGYEDWRLPTIQELQSITDYGRENPAINPIFVNTSSNNYWSSTTSVNYNDNAWIVTFDNGGMNNFNKTYNYYVRCTRDGQ